MQKAKLVKLIKLMFMALALAFVYVLFRSLAGPSNFSDPVNLFDDVLTGQTAARRVGSDKVWVTRLSPSQAQEAVTVSPYVVDPSSGCETSQTLCVLYAATDRSGIGISFAQSSPRQLDPKTPWFGGFVDPTTGEVFDRLGRAYQETQKQRAALREFPSRAD